MGKKGQRGKGGQQRPVLVSESVRIRLAKVLEEFRISDEEVYTFEPGLSKQERAAIHIMCKKMGMISRSSGNGERRRLSVFKNKTKMGSLKKEDAITYLQFSEETKDVLGDLFTRFPPGEELNEDGLKNSSGKVGKRQTSDDSFCRPSIPKSELSQKVDELNTKISQSTQLRKTMQDRAKLPIASFKDTITSTLENHQVVLISGETGCGKTTQVPQYILDHMWGKGKSCKIVCTQPRRISAISVAERIAYERGETVGDNVGYKIRLESKGGRNSSIIFCTNGVLIRLLVGRGSSSSKTEHQSRSKMDCLQGITHIIVDEIHERDRFSDFMLAIVRDLLPLYPHLRMVLMSATIDAEKFSKYFNGCPVIQVPGFTFPVKKFYLEDVLLMLNSADGKQLNDDPEDYVNDEASLSDEYKCALDESINFALTNDEFNPLLELISAEKNPVIYDYQHSSTGISPLMVFAGKGRISDVCMLLSFGSDCSLHDRDGKSALDWAQQGNDIQVYEVIKQHMDKDVSRSAGDNLLDNYLASTNPEQIDTVLIERLLRNICNNSSEGAILVFLPGWEDINQTKERLFASPYFQDQSRFMVLSLHSMIPSAEQKKVFKQPPVGVRKIILSTNIAETAVTINDVVYVIDSGRMKEKSYDPYNNVSTLQSSWVSKANARQREGRAGRCQPGICYHLYSKVRAESLLEYQVPEIKRMPIEELCLQIKLLDPSCQIMDFLQKTLDPPVPETVHNAVTMLKYIGALTHDEGLTDLGEKFGSLPVHPSTSKMLLFAILMNCLEPALTLACAADYREPFVLPMFPDERKRASIAKIELASLYGGYSDQLAVVAAYDCWRKAKERGQESQFCSRYFISSNTMNMLNAMRKQLQNELAKNGFIPADISMCSLNAHDPGILRAVLMTGSYPMVGRFLPPGKNNRGTFVETANGSKVRLHPHSSNFGLHSTSSAGCPLVVYDEITRGDGGMHIKNCSVVSPYPLLLIATEMVVAPANDNGCESDEEDYCSSLEEDGIETNASSGQHSEEIMSSPDNFVSVVVDRWLNFKATALDVAQMYCLREHLYSAILFKIKNPNAVLPPALGASMYAIACILSFDGLPSMVLSDEFLEQQNSTVDPFGNNGLQSRGKKGAGYCPPSGYLQSLFFGKGHPPSNNNIKASNNYSALPSSKTPSRVDRSNPQKSQASGGVAPAIRSFKRRR